MNWHDFEKAAPDIAQIGKNFLYKPDRGEVAIFATVDLTGRPRVAPVSPIFSAQGVYVSVGAHTPKRSHLERNGLYAMHALVGVDDLEFQISGNARYVESDVEHKTVVSAIPFPSYDADDPIYELLIDRALVVTWPERSTRGNKMVWSDIRR